MTLARTFADAVAAHLTSSPLSQAGLVLSARGLHGGDSGLRGTLRQMHLSASPSPSRGSISDQRRRSVQQQIRSMSHAQRYFAKKVDEPAPLPHMSGVPMAINYVLPSAYKILSRDDSTDSWLWLRPGNKVGRISPGALHPSARYVCSRRANPFDLEWADISRERATLLTWMPTDSPHSGDPLAVYHVEHTLQPGKATPEKWERAAAPAPARKAPDLGVGEGAWNHRMLGSRNDPAVWRAIKEAGDRLRAVGNDPRVKEVVRPVGEEGKHITVGRTRSFNRFKKVHEPSQATQSALDYLHDRTKEDELR